MYLSVHQRQWETISELKYWKQNSYFVKVDHLCPLTNILQLSLSDCNAPGLRQVCSLEETWTQENFVGCFSWLLIIVPKPYINCFK